MSEFGRVCERRKLRVNVGKSKVMRCSRNGNGDRMHVIQNGESLEDVDCFKGTIRGYIYIFLLYILEKNDINKTCR